MPRAQQEDLRFISTLPANRIKDLVAGVSLADRTGYDINDLLGKVTIDRLTLAHKMNQEAKELLTEPVLSFRLVVNRSYYAMYQVIRGVVFYITRGDDHEKHSVLPGHIPSDFPSSDYWENELKTARLERNRADYEPYPRNDKKFEAIARHVFSSSSQLRSTAKSYLRRKGLDL